MTRTTDIEKKKLAFEYVIFKLIQWYSRRKSIASLQDFNRQNDFSKLKVLKLHFFVSAVNSRQNNLLDTFNNFYAMPFGHVESDIYNEIGSLQRYVIENLSLHILSPEKLETSFGNLDNTIKKEIAEAVDELEKENPDLVTYTALLLVDLSHNWLSWKSTYAIAQSRGLYSGSIPSVMIQEEYKFFSLSPSYL